ncbi:MAG TPA: hypothetical protein VFQ39_08125, partial [Longimicrobium sp.]|nr:hypothetical protein [Longimicrobium sp.]
MRVLRFLLPLACALSALALATTAEAQPRQSVVRPSTLRERAGELRVPARVTVVGRDRVDTVEANRKVVLQPGEFLVAKASDLAIADSAKLSPSAPPPSPPPTLGPGINPGPAPDAGDTEVSLQTRSQTSTRTNPPSPQRGDTTVLTLPLTVAAADSTTESGLRWLEPRVEIVGGGFRYDPRARMFVGRILVGILDRDRRGQRVTLPSPVDVQIGGELDDASPNPFSVTRTSIPFQQVTVRTQDVRRDTVVLLVLSTFDPEGTRLKVPVSRPAVVVRASPRHVAGLGLEKADVIIEAPFPDVTVPLSVTASRGRPGAATADVGPASAVVAVRSRGIGADTVTVAGGPYAGEVILVYDTPWLIALCVLLGGALGGVLRGLAPGRLPTARKRRVLAAQGILTGLGVSVLYV